MRSSNSRQLVGNHFPTSLGLWQLLVYHHLLPADLGTGETCCAVWLPINPWAGLGNHRLWDSCGVCDLICIVVISILWSAYQLVITTVSWLLNFGAGWCLLHMNQLPLSGPTMIQWPGSRVNCTEGIYISCSPVFFSIFSCTKSNKQPQEVLVKSGYNTNRVVEDLGILEPIS